MLSQTILLFLPPPHRLEDKAQLKEAALKKAELMLEEDAMRFDAFLKENDRKAHEALKRADREAKLKQEKVVQIKKLNQEVSKVESEISKYEERLSYCIKYKKFLDSLTPAEHKEKVKAAREERRKQRKAQKAANGDDEDDSEASDVDSKDDDFEWASGSGEDEMYFKEPSQLLDIFTQLEERNLFLIQNVQETEEALEELKQKFHETESTM
jgi:cilia- and flagella-associated protein 100